jgi:polysaccharide export outer membrane protein
MTSFPRTALILTAFAASGCALPAAAPTATQLEQAQPADPNWEFYIVKVSNPVVRALAGYRDAGFPQSLRLARYQPNLTLRPGDIITASIYETGGSSLFGAPPAAPPQQQTPGALPTSLGAMATTLPPQVIEPDGQVMVPFVGRMRVAGRTPAQAAQDIEARLGAQAVQPQVIVSVVTNGSSAVTVGGEVRRAGLVPLTLRGEKLLDVIAQAGGPQFPATETDVRVMRGNVVSTIPLQYVLANPADNITMRPSDNVVLVRNPKTFVVMGAANKVAQYPFESERVTLAEAVARSGGPADMIGNIAGIYLFRYEPNQVARDVLSAAPNAIDRTYAVRGAVHAPDSTTRVMYRIDLSQADGYFLAQQITMRDKDIVLVSNAEATQLQKFFTLIRGATGVVYDISGGRR